MMRKQILLLLAIAGVLATIAVVIRDQSPATAPTALLQPAIAPYAAYVSGAGVVEANSRNIAVGTPVPGIVKEIAVKVGDRVEPGAILFAIDDRDLRAQLLTATANVKTAAAALREPRHRLNNAENLRRASPAAMREQDLSDLRDQAAQAEAAIELAQAQVEQIKMEMDRRIVRAPIAGTILQSNMRPGEYVEGGNPATPAMIIGDDTRLHVRVDIDENEAWRVRPGAAATAFVRGNPQQTIALEFEYIEPFVVAKSALTGQSTERTDRRVLQVIYGFDRGGGLVVYIGQQMDVYLEAAPVAPAGSEANR